MPTYYVAYVGHGEYVYCLTMGWYLVARGIFTEKTVLDYGNLPKVVFVLL